MNLNKVQIIAVIIGIVVIALGVISYNKGTSSTEEIFSKVSKEIQSHKFIRAKVDGSFIIKDASMADANNLPAGVYPKVSFYIDEVFPSDYYTSASEDMKGSANVKFSIENFVKDIGLISADIDLIALKRTLLYLRLNELAGVPMDLSSIKGKWWKMDLEAIAKNFTGVNSDELLKSVNSSEFSKEEIEQLKAIGKKYKNAIHVQKLADGEIEGAPAYHWSIALDEEKSAEMFLEIIKINSRYVEYYAKYGDEIKISDIKAALKMLDINSFEVFIQKKNYLPAQVKFSIDILDEKTGKDVGVMDMSIMIYSSGPVEIKAPADATDVIYLIGNLMSSMPKNNRVPVSNPKVSY